MCRIAYFQNEYPDQSSQIAFYLTLAYVYPQLPLLLLLVKFANRVPFSVRIVGSLTVQTATMALLPVVAPYRSVGAPRKHVDFGSCMVLALCACSQSRHSLPSASCYVDMCDDAIRSNAMQVAASGLRCR